ncbi:MAG TPA: hypothetical protein VEP50_04440 [bacterium]|nr:hypothetical protein [bacterium]
MIPVTAMLFYRSIVRGIRPRLAVVDLKRRRRGSAGTGLHRRLGRHPFFTLRAYCR